MSETVLEVREDWDWTTSTDVAEGPALADAGAMLLMTPATLAQEAGRPDLAPVTSSLPDASYLEPDNDVALDAPELSSYDTSL